MHSNFEWQKHQANERIERYCQEAADQRQAAADTDRKRGSFLLPMALLAGVFLIGWLMTGCAPRSASATVRQPNDSPAGVIEAPMHSWSMAERISFQDERDSVLDEQAAPGESGWRMAERIQFQDKREAYLGLRR